jgi:transcriptional regulator with XRE-family HTH domain
MTEVRELRTTSQRLRQFHRASGLTKTALAQKANVSVDTIARIEQSDQTGYNPKVATLAKIAGALGVKVGEMTNRGYLVAL